MRRRRPRGSRGAPLGEQLERGGAIEVELSARAPPDPPTELTCDAVAATPPNLAPGATAGDVLLQLAMVARAEVVIGCGGDRPAFYEPPTARLPSATRRTARASCSPASRPVFHRAHRPSLSSTARARASAPLCAMETLRCPRCETMAISALCASCGTQIDAFHLRRAHWALAGAAAAIGVGTFVGWLSFDPTHSIPAKVAAMHVVLEASGGLAITPTAEPLEPGPPRLLDEQRQTAIVAADAAFVVMSPLFRCDADIGVCWPTLPVYGAVNGARS